MRLKTSIKPVGAMLIALLTGISTGCVDEAKLNTDTATYTPEDRPLGILAGNGAEYEPGSNVTLSGRLVGTVNGQSIVWTQIEGTAIEGVTDWTSENITFTAPDVIGIESFKFQIAAINSDGSVATDVNGDPLVAETEVTVFDPATKIFYEIEDPAYAELVSVEAVSSGDNYLSGASGAHTADIVPGASVVFTIPMEQDAFVTLYAAFGIPAAGYGSKNAIVTVNGVDNELVINATGSVSEYRVGVVKLNAGDNVIEVGGGWNYYRLDYLMTVPAAQPPAPLAVPATLTNPNAQASAVSMMEYLSANYGVGTLSGQTEYPNKGDGSFPLVEFDKVVAATSDDAPAIIGFDFIDMSATRVSNGTDSVGLSEAMIAHHNTKNVMLSALWHWNAPMHLLDADGDGVGDVSGSSDEAWWSGFYTRATSFDLAAALADTSSPEYTALISDIDTISAELKKFSDAEIPILWRPLHEAEGAWFWWGAAGADALKELWILMYERMTNTHGLNNLIWVYTHAGSIDENWYPGDAYVDIVGYDGYDGNNADNPFKSQYAILKDRHNGKKMVALTETGTIPNVALMHEQNAWWSFFITWNSGGEYGPDGIDAATIDTNYAYDGVINLADIPGGRSKVEAGAWATFETSTADWGAQINWANTPGISVSGGWATNGANALSLVKDLSAETDPTGVVFQAYPAAGIDVSEVSTITVSAHAVNAGPDTTIKLFVKHGDDWAWVDSGAMAISADGIELSVDVSEFDWLAGLGLHIENFDPTATAAEFYLDNVRADDAVLYDFEPAAGDWGAQVNWANTSGITITDDWSATGSRALTLYKDLTQETDPSGVVFQAYPAGGIDVTNVSTIKLTGHAIDAGAATTIKLFVKHGDDWVWVDSGAQVIADNGIELEVDVSGFTWLAGLGVQIENFDAASTNAKFYIDNIRADDAVLYDFEGTQDWEFQVNWGPASGLHIASDWTAEGNYSLAGTTQLVDGDDNIILQTYPVGGLLLGTVSTLNVTAYAKEAGDAVQVQLFAKDKDGAWRDGGAFDLAAEGTELSLDIADMGEISGFGVRFMGAVNSSSESHYYIDNVVFE
ncbi:mannan endo-1,4-beta-mannosidase [Paraglaciecola aquimarina]|uniref:Mannan endo-1,4-beta-mannosidase n=1 Tax=Paraglaciecola algarum TaxID=3050085 RepID=A0ABS9D944_9ALTE|nr:glycosyl hydrolase [Paraglaciecola sp. G1-23]MCF2949439.1 mannan endo-1,4-beta-mannosidase [Paraglaciecola sp. G1-23]